MLPGTSTPATSHGKGAVDGVGGIMCDRPHLVSNAVEYCVQICPPLHYHPTF